MFSRSAVAAFVAVPLLARIAFAASCTRSYTVQDGDYCDKISASNNVSTYQLAAVNPTIDNLCDNLEVAQVLCLGTDGEDCKNTHVVVPNDTCDLLTSTYGINSTILYHNNPQLDTECDNLYIGEVVCVANAALAPAPPAGSPPATTIPASATPAKTASASISTASPTASASAEDDDDLPWCDEL